MPSFMNTFKEDCEREANRKRRKEREFEMGGPMNCWCDHPDPQPLIDDIVKLSKENVQLKKELDIANLKISLLTKIIEKVNNDLRDKS